MADGIHFENVTGQVAETINNIGLMLTKLSESRLQADFFETTGMRCSRNVRLLMEKLMEDHSFTSIELRRPWRSGALVPDGNKGNVKGASQVFDAVYGWGGCAYATLVYLAVAGVGFLSLDKGSHFAVQGTLIFAIASPLYICALAYLAHITIIPQRTAKKVLRVIQENGGATALVKGNVEMLDTHASSNSTSDVI